MSDDLTQSDYDPDRTRSKSPEDFPKSQRIGPYKLLQQIGEGGMGEVWMAEQEKPVRRRVALKLIKQGLDNKQILARFEAERQALAMMDHQNIAKVLDAGTTERGQPYFVMELIQGIPFTQYCDQYKVSIDQRLALFIPVCKAVQHAHQKGIIHRDLKPSNVLVSMHDGKPVPKIIDFGLAKALQHQTKLTDKTIFTEFGQVVGTLQYMSPEQAEMNQLDIDTRTDIYSLGVMLYELLTGSTPIEKEILKQQAMLKVLEFIRQKEPPRPSVRLSSVTNEAASGISDRRRIEVNKLKTILRGELDWIVMKALEKDRTRRYETANGFAEDLSRYLSGDVVTARPPSAGYRIRKLVGRNKGVLASLFSITVATFAGIVATGWFVVQRNIEAEKARFAVSRQKISDETNSFINREVFNADVKVDDLSSISEPELDNKLTLRELLERAADSLQKRKDLEPLVEANLYRTLANYLVFAGNSERAIALLGHGIKLQRNRLGPEHPETLLTTETIDSIHIQRRFYKQAALAIESLHVIPWKIDGDRLKEALPPMGARDYVLPTSADAIEVRARLSRKGYSYIVLYRSDGKDVLLFPQDDTEIPPLTDQPRYPSTRPDVRYVLNDGPGIWAVAVLSSETPLPSYREWRQQRPDQPWKPQPDPTRLSMYLLDTGGDWRTLGTNRSYNRGEQQFQVEPYQQQMDWLKRQVEDGAVMGMAFPIF